MPPFFALTFRGLEKISALELARLPGIYVQSIDYRRISGYCDGSLQSLLALRTVDDVFIHVATWTGIEPQRSGLITLRRLSSGLNLLSAVDACREVRSIRRTARFSVTVSWGNT